MAVDLSALGAMNGYNQLNRTQTVAEAPKQEESGVKQAAESFAQVFDRADQAVSEFARGEGSAQAVVEAMAQAELALQTAVTIRDKVVEAYQETLRMPI